MLHLSLSLLLLSLALAHAAPSTLVRRNVTDAAVPVPTPSNATASAGPTPLTDSSIDMYTIIACSVVRPFSKYIANAQAGGLLLVLAVALAFVYRYYHPQHLRERAPYPRTHMPQASLDSTHKGSVRSFLTEPMEAIVDREGYELHRAAADPAQTTTWTQASQVSTRRPPRRPRSAECSVSRGGSRSAMVEGVGRRWGRQSCASSLAPLVLGFLFL